MKQLLIAGALLVSLVASAQDGEKKNLVKVNMLSPLVRTGSFFYERKIGTNSSLQLGVFYTGSKFDELKLRGFGITPEFRYYASEKGAMEGFYLAPFLRYQHYEITELMNKGTLNTFGGGLLIGKQWIFTKGISVDMFAGPSYNTGSVKVIDGTDNFDLPGGVNGFGVRAGLTVGIAF
ncbi:MAG: DUF3575 domain-containing protein [Chitinophagales bacterium]|jgi:hypothetical protein|nr:DUF3575 domain-containing protein [Chitinophagales bacterium]